MSDLAEHARRELETIGEDPDWIESVVKMVEIFSTYGHSGGSSIIAIEQLRELLQGHNISPLTNDPEEWFHHGSDSIGYVHREEFWQNKRNGEAFSQDGGKTYYLLSDGASAINPHPLYVAREARKK